jgi:hypothetical protein
MAERCNCDECVTDPSLTCSYTGDDVSTEAVYIANAYKGHLILCPGGANGQIGGLLHELTPPQHYSHMGIMVSDFDLVRHCTAAPTRLTAKEYFSGSVLGVAAPVDGLDPDHLQYGWPGSVSQSAWQIHFADRYAATGLTPPGAATHYKGADLVDRESPSGRSYRIAAVSFDSVVDGGTTYPALVVKPCPRLETQRIDAALRRVADRALKLYAHYRFYCYTDGSVGGFTNYLSPRIDIPAALPDWDPDTMTWADWSDPHRVHWRQQATIPGVCSSFVWQAVRDVSDQGPHIVLDWAKTEEAALGDQGSCHRAVPPDWTGDVVDSETQDGLYLYDEAARRRAAEWLHDALSDEVFSSLKSSLAHQGGVLEIIADALDDIGRVAFITAAELGADALVAALVPVLGPAAAAAVDAKLADDLIRLLYVMPARIADQVCTSFAFDCHRGFPSDMHCVDADGNTIGDPTDNASWDDAPGVGRAVSPDNIHMFWDAPSDAADSEIFGLYGYNEPVALVVGVVRKPVCEVVPSSGTATVRGMVRYRDQSVIGAYVKINCQHVVTGKDLGYQLTVRSGGQYKVVARYTDPHTGTTLYGERATGPIGPGGVVTCDINLSEPPDCMRNVLVSATIRVDDVYLTGVDHAEASISKRPLFVQNGVARFDADAGTWIIDNSDPAIAARRTDVTSFSASVGDASGQLTISVRAHDDDLGVDVTVTGALEDLSVVRTYTVADGQTRTVGEIPGLDTGGPFNDRAYFRGLVFSNLPAQAI